jgi:type III secretory pathway component EscS
MRFRTALAPPIPTLLIAAYIVIIITPIQAFTTKLQQSVDFLLKLG